MPDPVPGFVIGYACLWRDEALRGQDEGRMDRPSVIVVAVRHDDGKTIITVAPVTQSAPTRPDIAIEIPARTRRRLGLDAARSWIIAADLNRFPWPGVDPRPSARGEATHAHGLLPTAMYRQPRDRVLTLARAGRTATTSRGDEGRDDLCSTAALGVRPLRDGNRGGASLDFLGRGCAVGGAGLARVHR
jgi:hypothetical protein